MKIVTDSKYYDEIAGQLVEFGAYSNSLAPADMADAVADVASLQNSIGYDSGFGEGYTDGEETGWADGFDAGYAEGEAKGYCDGETQGRQAEYDEFWDSFQNYGNRTRYGYAFTHWTKEAFKPKYDIKPVGSAGFMFAYSSLTDIAQHLEDCGRTLDTSAATNLSEFVSYTATINRLPEISTVGASALGGIFYNCYIVTIDKLILKSDGSQTYGSSAFASMYNLTNIVVEGYFGANTSFAQSSRLTYESLMSIINALYDYSGTTETRTLTLHATAKARLSEADIAIGTQKGWSIV